MICDYHVHTEYSDDSICAVEDQLERAIALGLKEICFTDHVDYGIKKDWYEGNIRYRNGEPCANVDYPSYFRKLAEMKEKYGDRITIKQGLEFGAQMITLDKFNELFARYEDELDFTLLSIHQVDNLEFWTQEFQEGRTQKEYNERYYEEMYNVVKNFKHYSVLAHMDLLSRYDMQGVYPFENVKDRIAEILKVVIADGKGIEMNTSSWHYNLKDVTPSRDILRLYKDLGGKIITMGSDAHTTQYLADHMEEAQSILKNEIGFEGFYTFTEMEPEFHAFGE